ncbi:MAG: hypothetical protein OHK0057_28380 [Thermoflexibacter sp.]
MFSIGDKVVCVDADFSMYPQLLEVYRELPKLHQVYTIRAKQFIQGHGYRVLLEEIENPPVYIDLVKGKVEPGFNASRFALLSDPIKVGAEEIEEVYA